MFIRTLSAVVVSVALFVEGTGLPAAAAAQESKMVVTLLGTGTPTINIRRFGFANLIQAGGLNLMIDAGRGAGIRLFQLGLPLGSVDAIFLTHFHSDHISGLPDLYATGYLGWKLLGGRSSPLQVYGPKGTSVVVEGLTKLFAADSAIRSADEGIAADGTKVIAHEFEVGVIFEKAGVRVTAFPVDHGDKIKPAVGYRVDYAGHSVVFSGDTKYDETVIRNSEGVDLLVHEFAAAPSEMASNPLYIAILDHHTAPREAGRVFAKASPKLAVYSHMGLLPGPRGLPGWDEVISQTRDTYKGPLVVGEDLMQFQIGDGAPTILMRGPEWPR
ncbi:MBL fold metallo-hydrolase [Bradyrhizobium jicamae]|uniref:MBL fold metallo-hydrolase n=1 Tax=Bradyrhizobium jicamae TaxID=280332 RepID=UPI001BA7D759|nr:MBL fold metallo-hydrolase [Bradyrhizobium jicamae]MBR0751561.1 MBL fold metallo-hydrolase [Bradyrhizobium jicamae]